jgi:ankyrin repeat protein
MTSTRRVLTDEEAINEFGMTAIGRAIRYGGLDAVRQLIQEGLDINVQHERASMLPLHYAARLGKREMVSELIAAGARVNARGRVAGETVINHAMECAPELLADLVGAGAYIDAGDFSGRTALQFAAVWGDADLVATLLQLGASVWRLNSRGQAILHLAAMAEHPAGAAALVRAGAEVHARTPEMRWTPLHTAVAARRRPTVEILIEEGGADIDARDIHGATALHLAAVAGDQTTTSMLIGYGADLTATTENREREGHPYEAELGGELMPAGTPLDQARGGGYRDVATLLGGSALKIV